MTSFSEVGADLSPEATHYLLANLHLYAPELLRQHTCKKTEIRRSAVANKAERYKWPQVTACGPLVSWQHWKLYSILNGA